MADVDHRQAHLVAHALQPGDEVLAARLVERRERLVEQQDRRLRQQRPPDRHPLRLAAGQVGRTPPQQVGDAQQFHHRVQSERRLLAALRVAAVQQVAAHVAVREQSRVLEHIADAAPVRGHVDAGGGIEQHPAIDGDAPGHRSQQPGDGIEHRGLARARRPGQGQHPRAGFDPHLALEVAPAQQHVDVEHQSSSSRRLRRTSHSEAINAAREIATATRASRQMPASPPGTCSSA